MRGKINLSILKSGLLHAVIILIIFISIYWKSNDQPIGTLIDVDGAPKQETKKSSASKVEAKSMSSEGSTQAAQGVEVGIAPSEMQKYFAEVMNRINQAKKYPNEARLNEQEGLVQLKLEIAPDGKILSVEIEKNSSFKSLDDSATITIQRLGQLPPLPLNSDGTVITKSVVLHIPIQFKLN